MKTKLIILFTFFIALTTFAQEKLSTKTGTLKFEASTPNFEPVAATNSATSAILKDDGAIVVLTLIKGFQFKKALMQEHFNSKKWANSKEFPKAKFSGQLEGYNAKDLALEAKEYKVFGKLTFHGVTNNVTTTATLKKVDGVVYFETKFAVEVADYNINVKSKLAKKIAKTVNIEVILALK
jgi:hypothetical protein